MIQVCLHHEFNEANDVKLWLSQVAGKYKIVQFQIVCPNRVEDMGIFQVFVLVEVTEV